jgi:hypothetical protein
VPPGDGERRANKGHGHNGTGAYRGARKIEIRHAQLVCGDACPKCARRKVYPQRQPKTLVRIVGQAPLEATVFEMQRLRCNAYGQVFTAEEPEGLSADCSPGATATKKYVPRSFAPARCRRSSFTASFAARAGALADCKVMLALDAAISWNPGRASGACTNAYLRRWRKPVRFDGRGGYPRAAGVVRYVGRANFVLEQTASRSNEVYPGVMHGTPVLFPFSRAMRPDVAGPVMQEAEGSVRKPLKKWYARQDSNLRPFAPEAKGQCLCSCVFSEKLNEISGHNGVFGANCYTNCTQVRRRRRPFKIPPFAVRTGHRLVSCAFFALLLAAAPTRGCA